MPGVTCHMSGVAGHILHVTCHLSHRQHIQTMRILDLTNLGAESEKLLLKDKCPTHFCFCQPSLRNV